MSGHMEALTIALHAEVENNDRELLAAALTGMGEESSLRTFLEYVMHEVDGHDSLVTVVPAAKSTTVVFAHTKPCPR